MKISGSNECYRFGFTSDKSSIYPPCDSSLYIPSLLSFSADYNHSVWISKEKQCFGVGSNQKNQINGFYDKKIFNKPERFNLTDKTGKKYDFISAVCGRAYTLYLISKGESENNQLVYSYNDKYQMPYFVSINGQNPKYLFGGHYSAAAIDSNGSIFIIINNFNQLYDPIIQPSLLPENEKAIDIAFCKSFIYALGTSGKVYCSSLDTSNIEFNLVEELKEVEITEISGTNDHILAVTKDGHVYGCGSNYNSQLGFGTSFQSVPQFTEIRSTLQKYKIKSVSAGFSHSLFITEEGMVLACGTNNFGQLFISNSYECVFSPTETTIKSGATFCIAGCAISVAFIGTEPPPNTPNRTIREKTEIESDATSEGLQESISKLKEENEKLKNDLKNTQLKICRLAGAIEWRPLEDIRYDELTEDKIDELCSEAANLKKISVSVEKNLPSSYHDPSEVDSVLSMLLDDSSKLNELLQALTGDDSISTHELSKEQFNKIKNDAKKKSTDSKDSNTQQPSSNQIEILDSEAINDLEKIEEIGSGGGGRVYKVFKKEIYALKEMISKKSVHKDFQSFLREYELLSMLKHPNILNTYGFFFSDAKHPPSILLEFCSENLDDAVCNKSLSNVQTVFFIYQIAEGMKYVHFKQIIHRDLKPSNILIASDGTIKICDFGISKLMTVEEQSKTRGVGTQKFMAPENINEEEYDEKVDVYSFGVLVFFVLNNGDLSSIKIGDIFKGKKFAIPEKFTSFAKQLISDCCSLDANARPSFKDILDRMESNKYILTSLSPSEMKEVELMIKEHKEKISY